MKQNTRISLGSQLDGTTTARENVSWKSLNVSYQNQFSNYTASAWIWFDMNNATSLIV